MRADGQITRKERQRESLVRGEEETGAKSITGDDVFTAINNQTINTLTLIPPSQKT